MDKPICKKVYFSSEKIAEEHILKFAKTSVRSRIPVRSYYCNKCGFWHLTSKQDKLKEVIDLLQEENRKLREENIALKNKDKRELDREVSLDERIKRLNQTISDKNKIISRQRLDISNLVSQLNAPSQIDKFNNKYSKQE